MGEVSQSETNDTPEFWRSHYQKKFQHVFSRIGRAKSHQVFSTLKSPLIPVQEKGRRVPVHIQHKVANEIRNLIQEGPILKLNKCTSGHFISPIVITAKKDSSVKLAMDAKLMNDQIHKNQYQMPNLLALLNSPAQIMTSNNREGWFTSMDLKKAFGQISLSDGVSSQCNFNILYGEQTCTYRPRLAFMDLQICPKNSRKRWTIIFKGCREFSVRWTILIWFR